jgi:peptidoglycan/LPS O-acetylase OafA/YrhL
MDQLAGHHLLFSADVVHGVSFSFSGGFHSSLTLCRMFSRVHPCPAKYWKFLWDRLTKIYPVHCAITVAMIPAIQSPNLPLDWRAPVIFCLQCLAKPETTLLQLSEQPTSWSISCEWFFYLCAPFVLYALSGRYLRIALIAVVAVYAAHPGWFVTRRIGGAQTVLRFLVRPLEAA